jgi:hypothetical protein
LVKKERVRSASFIRLQYAGSLPAVKPQIHFVLSSLVRIPRRRDSCDRAVSVFRDKSPPGGTPEDEQKASPGQNLRQELHEREEAGISAAAD